MSELEFRPKENRCPLSLCVRIEKERERVELWECETNSEGFQGVDQFGGKLFSIIYGNGIFM